MAEFFAGIGLMRLGLEEAGGYQVVWSNDIEPSKAGMYRRHFGDDPDHFWLGSIRGVRGYGLPDIDVATASFPCTDLSLAGWRSGLSGADSSMFWEYHRILDELAADGRLPPVALLENVQGFASSREGTDLEEAVEKLNELGYVCDLLAVDASWFVPQSRPRMFVVGALQPGDVDRGWEPTRVRPRWIGEWVASRPHLKTHAHPLPEPPDEGGKLADIMEQLPADSSHWWGDDRVHRFRESLSARQSERLESLVDADRIQWRTAYRRTRKGRAVWEIRNDEIAGCLRTARGGSSKQAVVQAGCGSLRIRWMTPREYARLQGAPNYRLKGARPNEAYFGFGDAVCVPSISWIARHLIMPLVDHSRRQYYRPG